MHPSVKLILYISFFIASLWDIKTRTIPNTVHILIIAAGILHIGFGGISIKDSFIAAGVLTAVTTLFTLTIDPMCGGDYKMMIALAFAFGLYDSVYGFLIMFFLKFLYMLLGLATKKLKDGDAVPVALFMSIGFVIITL